MRATFIGLWISATAAVAFAQFPATEAQQFSTMTALDAYGEGLALAGDVLVVGVPGADNGAPSSGTAFVFRRLRGAWTFEQELGPLTPVLDGCFGEEIAFDGTTIVFGSTRPGSSTGYVDVFTFDGATWTGVALTEPPGFGSPSNFGTEVAVDGDWILVANTLFDADFFSENSGVVHAYERVGGLWTYRESLRSSAEPEFLNFGTALDLSGSTALIGTNLERVMFFELAGGTWVQGPVFASDDPTEDTDYALELALDGDVAVVAARGDDDVGLGAGAAYVYRRTCEAWAFDEKLAPATLESGDAFGQGVAMSGDVLLIGAYNDDHSATSSAGSVHAYRWDGFGWQPEQLMVASDPDDFSWFGWSIAIDGDLAAVSARLDDTFGPTSGKVYTFDATPVFDPWTEGGGALPGVAGAPELRGAGTLQPGDPVQWTLGCAAPNTTAAFVLGASTIDAPFKGGVLVPAPDLLITGLPTDAAGGLVLAGTWPAGVPSGTALHQQMWILDAVAPQDLSASNAVTATVP